MVAVIITYPARCVCKAGGVKLPREMLIRKKSLVCHFCCCEIFLSLDHLLQLMNLFFPLVKRKI